MHENDLTSLDAGLFSGLTALTTLWLQLTSLPDGLFDGLTALTSLLLFNNSAEPTITVSLEWVVDGQFMAKAHTGAPFEIVLPVTVANGTIDGGATTVTILKGSIESNIHTVSRTSGTTAAVTVDIGTLPGLPTDLDADGERNHEGYKLVKSDVLPLEVIAALTSGICGRTQQVRDAILASVSGVSACGDVTGAHLVTIDFLYLANKSISGLKAGDFSGLTALTTLELGYNQLTSLDAGLFSGLTALTHLRLYGNDLNSLPEGLFSGLNRADRTRIVRKRTDQSGRWPLFRANRADRTRIVRKRTDQSGRWPL